MTTFLDILQRQANRLLFVFKTAPVILFIMGGVGYIFYLPVKIPAYIDWLLRFFFDAGLLPLLLIGYFYAIWNRLQQITYWLLLLIWLINAIYAVLMIDADFVFMIYSLLIWCIFVVAAVKHLTSLNKC